MSKDDLDDVLGLAKSVVPELPDNEKLNELSLNVEALISLRERIEKGEEFLAELKKQELRLSGEVIPSIMDEIGVTEIKTTDGHKVSYKPFYSGKIREEAEDRAYEWLEDSGHGGVIKGQMILDYRRPQRDEVLALKKLLLEMGWETALKLGVHHSTLRALFKEIIEDEGETLPPDLFDVFVGRKTTIK